VIAIDDENNLHITTRKVKDALIRNGISNYVAVRHPREESKVIIVTRDEAQRHGKYHCRHCGIEFDDKCEVRCSPKIALSDSMKNCASFIR